jgi:Transposase IS116/IS110/IS902 family
VTSIRGGTADADEREPSEVVRSQIRDIEGTRLEHLKQAPGDGPHVMVRLLARVIGVGVETADMLVQEVLSRNLRDRRAVARYGGLTGSPDESGKKRREKGLARSGNERVRRGMIQLAWRFLMFQKDSALAHWFYARTKNAPQTRKTMIVALARKLLIALWRLAREGERSRRVSSCVQLYERSYREIFRQLRPASLQAREGGDDGSRWRGPDRPPWLSCREKEWVRRFGASPPMRMRSCQGMAWQGRSTPQGWGVGQP